MTSIAQLDIWVKRGRQKEPKRGRRSCALGVAHVPDGRGTFMELSVEENMKLGAYTRHDAKVAGDFERMFGYFPRLKQRYRQQAGTLSGGEQQMLAIARALLLRPKLLLLDEPSFGLAPLIVQEIFGIMRRIRDEEGVSILLVEQNASLALALRRTGLPAGDRPHRGLRPGGRDQPRRVDPPFLPRLLREHALGRLDAPGHVGHRHRRHLCLRRARPRDDLPGDPPRELRAGRDGDVLDLHRAHADQCRPALLGGVRRHAGDLVRASASRSSVC